MEHSTPKIPPALFFAFNDTSKTMRCRRWKAENEFDFQFFEFHRRRSFSHRLQSSINSSRLCRHRHKFRKTFIALRNLSSLCVCSKNAIHYRFASKKRSGRSLRIEAKLAAFWSRRVSRSKRAGVAVLVECQKNQKNSIRLNMERSLSRQFIPFAIQWTSLKTFELKIYVNRTDEKGNFSRVT